jgi:uncharacterized membrane protein (TIGR02234 family)
VIRSLSRVQFAAFVGIAFVFLASSRPWALANLNATNAPALHLAFSGRQLDAVPVALGALASVIVVLAGIVRSTMRRVLGFILLLVASGIGIVSLSQWDPALLVKEAIADSIGTYQDNYTFSTTVWPWLSVFGAVVVFIAGAILVLVEFPDRVRKAKYERTPSDETLTQWQALDRGIDPTFTNSTPLE